MKNLKIKIPNMQSSHCIMRVNNAINQVKDVAIINIQPGVAHVELINENKEHELFQSIERAGYKVELDNSLNGNSGVDETILKFKTNINCGSCVESVTKPLNEANGICHWDVDTTNKDKVLSVHSKGISTEEVIDLIKTAGYKIELF